MLATLKSKIFNLKDSNFEELSLEVCQYQYENNAIYHQFINNLTIPINQIDSIHKIPFLPIEIFKYQKIYTGQTSPENYFESSGTTSQDKSKHYYYQTDFYLNIAQKIFENEFGALENYHLIGLLPSYLERQNSSLICMVDSFIKKSNSTKSGYFLNNFKELNDLLKVLKDSEKKTLILGVSFGILDWLEFEPLSKELKKRFELGHFMIMETGGMKGRRKEIFREELHKIIQSKTSAKQIYSEYGMTELFSQSYSQSKGIFRPGFTKRIILRELNDPFTYINSFNKIGGINIIDLANIDSLSFIATQDTGKLISPRSFELMGRIQQADLRGCNLMIS